MNTVTSADGTPIALHRAGSGPVVVLVGGGLDDGTENAPLAAALAEQCTVINYARRGRAPSGDTQPYAVERELDDIAALVAHVDAPVCLFGASSGGGLALEAAAAGLPVARVAVYDVPYCISDAMQRRADDYVAQLGPALAEGRHGDALELFMQLAGSGPEVIAAARAAAFWPGLEDLAPTLAYDAACMRGYRLPAARLAAVTAPTLVIDGGRSAGGDEGMAGLPPDFFAQAADAVAAAVPAATRVTLDSQGHVADPAVLAPVLLEFFT
jgi:hypothetical protein